MKTFRLLDEADHQQLASLLNSDALPRLSGAQAAALTAFLAETSVTRDPAELECRIALCDHVTLVSPADSRDWYKPAIVLPHHADVDADRISVLTPMGLAVLGRKTGEEVSWETAAGSRLMTITGVVKEALLAS